MRFGIVISGCMLAGMCSAAADLAIHNQDITRAMIGGAVAGFGVALVILSRYLSS